MLVYTLSWCIGRKKETIDFRQTKLRTKEAKSVFFFREEWPFAKFASLESSSYFWQFTSLRS